jgi:two-component system, LytTR family, sensor kinase
MNNWITYENIWARNIIFGGIMFTLLFTQSKFAPNIPGLPIPSDFDMVWQFLLLYTSLFTYNHFALRKFFFAKKYISFALITVAFILLFSNVTMFLELRENTVIRTPFFGQVLSSLLTVFIASATFLTNNWILNNIIKTKKTLLDKEAELNFLKQQLSPHFLFNAINNLYGTALAAPEIITDKILELSDLLRYQVESTTKNDVTIEEERAFVENYINYTTYKSNDLVVTNETLGKVESFKLPPLLFLPLLENAIKYSSETESAFIHILWQLDSQSITFSIENSYLTEGSKIKGTKVGLDNLKKRLGLLNIKHTLKTDLNTKNIYKIELRLWELSINAQLWMMKNPPTWSSNPTSQIAKI